MTDKDRTPYTEYSLYQLQTVYGEYAVRAADCIVTGEDIPEDVKSELETLYFELANREETGERYTTDVEDSP